MKTAIITGASGGIGLELARLAAADGYQLLLTARNAAKLQEIAGSITNTFSVGVDVFAADLSKPEEVKRLIEYSVERKYEVEMLINNAGFGDYGLFAESSAERMEEMIDLNIRALTVLSRHFLPSMLARGKGYIMNVASVAAFMPGPLMGVYYATKAYVLSLTRALAEELRGSGVKVSALCPGPTATGFFDAANLHGSRLFSILKPARVEPVARFGYAAMKRGKRAAVHGFSNKAMTLMVRLLPSSWVTANVKMISEKRKQ